MTCTFVYRSGGEDLAPMPRRPLHGRRVARSLSSGLQVAGRSIARCGHRPANSLPKGLVPDNDGLLFGLAAKCLTVRRVGTCDDPERQRSLVATHPLGAGWTHLRMCRTTRVASCNLHKCLRFETDAQVCVLVSTTRTSTSASTNVCSFGDHDDHPDGPDSKGGHAQTREDRCQEDRAWGLGNEDERPSEERCQKTRQEERSCFSGLPTKPSMTRHARSMTAAARWAKNIDAWPDHGFQTRHVQRVGGSWTVRGLHL